MITFKERFFVTSNGRTFWAPSTIGAPQFLHSVDYSAFKKSRDEKLFAKITKSEHRKELRKFYGKECKRKLNAPHKQLAERIILQF